MRNVRSEYGKKPHPANIVKKYALRQVIQNMKDKRKIK